MRDRLQKKSSAVPPEEEALLTRLAASLSDSELRRVLAGALLELNDGARARLIARLGADTGAALGPALKPPPRSGRRTRSAISLAGKGKTLQEWDRLWREWNAVVEEAGHEHGKYVLQEADWEPPYLDTVSLSTDLDAVAARMRPLMSRMSADRIAPEFSFTNAIEALDDDLGAGLPDGIEPDGSEPCGLGPAATSSLLEWEWAVARRDARDAPAFFDDIRDLESRLEHVDLDQPTVKKFVLGLPDEHLRALLESMTRQRSTKRWADAFTRARRCWAEILRALSRRWSPALHAETSRANIAQDWTLALPLVKDAVKRRAFDEAYTLIDEAARSLLRLDKSGRWDPRKELLIQRERFYCGEDEGTKLAALLRLWQQTAEGQGKVDLATALTLQIAALREAENGDVMLEAFCAVPPALHEVHDALFADWRALIVERTLPTWRSGPRVPCGGWVPALVDAAQAGPKGVAVFHAAVRGTLAEARSASAVKPRSAGHRHWPALDRDRSPLLALAIMTRDLDSAAPMLKESAPKLLKLLSASVDGERGRLEATRRSWCARLGARSLLPEVLAFWRDNVTRFVPDPGNTTADYTPSVDWLAAGAEINPPAARELLARWVATYRLRRNLWRDLARRGFSVSSR
jgi:hypothetical protein